MRDKYVPIGTIAPKGLSDAFEKECKKVGKTRSMMIKILIIDWLKRRKVMDSYLTKKHTRDIDKIIRTLESIKKKSLSPASIKSGASERRKK